MNNKIKQFLLKLLILLFKSRVETIKYYKEIEKEDGTRDLVEVRKKMFKIKNNFYLIGD